MKLTTGFFIVLGIFGLALGLGCKNRPEPVSAKQQQDVEYHPPEYWVKQLKAADAAEREKAAQQLGHVGEPVLKRLKPQLQEALKAETDPKAKAAIQQVYDRAATAP